MGSTTHFLYQKFVLFVGIFWVSLSSYVLPLFSFLRAFLFRFERNDSDSKGNSNRLGIYSRENSGKDMDFIEPKPDLQPEKDTDVEAKQDSTDFTDGFTGKETPEFSFKFKFPTFEEFSQSRGEISDSINFDTEVVTFNPKELTNVTNFSSFADKDDAKDGIFSQINSKAKAICEEIPEQSTVSEAKAIGEEIPVESTSGFCSEDVLEKMDATTFMKEEENPVDAGKILRSGDMEVHSEKESLAMDSDSESFGSSPLRSVMNRLIDSYSNGFLSDRDFGGESSDFDESHLDDSIKDHKEDEFDEDGMFSMEEKEADFQDEGNSKSDFLSEKDFSWEMDNSNDKVDSGKVNSKETQDWDSDDSNKLETLWEHQELLEQLKNELKKVKATGLPTILEESEESPKIMEDLKPWKIDEKFQRVDRIDDLHKLYRSYRERMRKFDILNFQKMYAIGFLQLKDPLQSISTSQKFSVQSIFPEKKFLSKRKKTGSDDPTMKFVEELQSELEVVYVGQMCLSWEILHWQYGKALKLWESDHRGVRLYNEVAGEFQQFQVLMQRFIEDEPFQGPRVQNYVKNRCVLRNLLQVPVVREDTREKRKAMKRGDYAITSDILIEILEESIRIFWRFVQADKDCSNAVAKCRKGPPVELEDPADTELLMELRANLQKKEKKLRELLRYGNCILKRFQKSNGDDSDHVLYFFSQVDMKLVARVLNMSRLTTEQLIWCRNKLTKISFENRKIRVEPSFLLFPC
ncbi:hypothetical protein Vadar_011832 [Vaccinium darrowii]|uniref:Uncharacterized protein n=1 Tax=Vaccinium darrowii TaxID=229202 RepID=A0ACB7XYU1_9ERIC|nr:hypothetical protein Vadar_011832 [Vaccinium darrowii]